MINETDPDRYINKHIDPKIDPDQEIVRENVEKIDHGQGIDIPVIDLGIETEGITDNVQNLDHVAVETFIDVVVVAGTINGTHRMVKNLSKRKDGQMINIRKMFADQQIHSLDVEKEV